MYSKLNYLAELKMAPKPDKGKAVASTSGNAPPSSLFLTEQHRGRYPNINKRDIIQERPMRIPADVEAVAEIEKQISRRGWKTLITYPKGAYTEMVREFYSNAFCVKPANSTFESFVRGKKVKFDAHTINSVLKTKLSKGKDEWEDLQKEGVDPELLLQKLCMEGTTWGLDRSKMPKKVPSCTLLPIPKVLANLIISNITPCSNKSDVRVERALLIHAIMSGKRIDVGKVIQNQIQIIANSVKNTLGYPHLITLLCEKAHVDTLQHPGFRSAT